MFKALWKLGMVFFMRVNLHSALSQNYKLFDAINKQQSDI